MFDINLPSIHKSGKFKTQDEILAEKKSLMMRGESKSAWNLFNINDAFDSFGRLEQ